ncbi:trans-2,3-dihydro-3-hydroxyanthranilate isomerase [Paenibacillus catalpae]|uniref:Trans-2,3-dihydro-3-hydroxyanthranilate isomerase n=1 Tax=Paenibacillus catalpae TaxID=1045775 RepID=A0A1I2GWJ7_9BACL|nr:PhzF family phenazine biosynthesis protein [Paenibacillus catalpae]SFF21510.1 trans-2,3-dihydro-3-hydroxyanthranilate isomerase [Paenibacillus catalpae]
MRFYMVDVFAERKYQGNQLAVLLPDRELETSEMQQIAKEFNFSEITFVMSGKKTDGGYDVRIFTPDVEIPFAGHPSLGTAYVIRHVIEKGNNDPVLLNLGVGQIPVAFAEGERPVLWMAQKQPEFRDAIEPSVIADILQIGVEDIDASFPIQVASTGLPAVIVPVKTLKAAQRCAIHHQKYERFLKEGADANILVFTQETLHEMNDLHVRVFVNDTGYYEDPATGSANGNLAGYLLEHEVLGKSSIQLRVEQGYSIGRDSLLLIDASKNNGEFEIKIGGKVFLVANGDWL